MFTIKVMQPKKVMPQSTSMKSMKFNIEKLEEQPYQNYDEFEQTVAMIDRSSDEEEVKSIFSEHEKSELKSSEISFRAMQEMERINDEVDSCRNSQRNFFEARRNIAKAACDVAKNHHINMHLIDDDSDDERDNFYSGRSTS